MTPGEFSDKMAKIYHPDYEEHEAHVAADNLMMDLLTSLGYDEGVAIFRKAERWYS